MPPEIVRLSDKFLSNPVKVEVARPAFRGADHPTQRLIATGPRARGQARDAARADPRREGPAERDHLLQSQARRGRSPSLRCYNTTSTRSPCMATWTSARACSRSSPSAPARTKSPGRERRRRPGGLDIPAVSHVFNLRHAAPRGGLRPPDRPHRPRRPRRRGLHAGRAGGHERSLAAIEKPASRSTSPWEGPTHRAPRPATEPERGRRRALAGRGGRRDAAEKPSARRRRSRKPSAAREPRRGVRDRRVARGCAAPRGAAPPRGFAPREASAQARGSTRSEPRFLLRGQRARPWREGDSRRRSSAIIYPPSCCGRPWIKTKQNSNLGFTLLTLFSVFCYLILRCQETSHRPRIAARRNFRGMEPMTSKAKDIERTIPVGQRALERDEDLTGLPPTRALTSSGTRT